MAKLRAKIIDRNRYSKSYPFVRAPKRNSFLGDQDLNIELGTITFTNQTEQTFYFDVQFSSTDYGVMAMHRDTSADGDAQVALMVDGSTINRSYVKIIASMPFTGQVDVMAIKIG